MITKIISVLNLVSGGAGVLFGHGEYQIRGIAGLVIGFGLAIIVCIEEQNENRNKTLGP